MNLRKEHLYFDGAADTPLAKCAFASMKPYMTDGFVGNPHSAHEFGREASAVLEQARADIMECLHCDSGVYRCCFTSGATEANNLAIMGSFDDADSDEMNEIEKRLGHRAIVECASEHSSVLEPMRHAALKYHCALYDLGVDPKTGGVEWKQCEELAGRLEADHVSWIWLTAISSVNNETGAYNDLRAYEAVMKEHHISVLHFLVDCTQALCCGGFGLYVSQLYPAATMISFGAHKIGGPEGFGVLLARIGNEPSPMIEGGSQESGLRAGTSNVPGAVGTAAALRHLASIGDLRERYQRLSTKLATGLKTLDQGCHFNGIGQANILNVTFSEKFLKALFPWKNSLDAAPWNGDELAQAFDSYYGIACSAGAACSAGGDGPRDSHVLRAMGLTHDQIARSVRFSFTERTSLDEIDELLIRISMGQAGISWNAKGNQ